jgi:hypothetical protein
MSMSLARLVSAVAISSSLAGATVVVGHAQARPAGRQPYTANRTPWGDPDLQGTYTNSNESGIPMQRPAEFAGRRLEDVKPEEMARLARERAARVERVAETIGATSENPTGAGPTHWYENYNPQNSRAWMISDPADGQTPATTEDARKRAAAVRAARRGGDGYAIGPFDGPEDLSLYVRCITRGVPGSMMPAIYGNSYDITQGPGWVAIRYEMVHETRVIPLDARPHVGAAIKSYMGDARGHFEGDTLVVETTNFLERSAYGGASERLRLTERFTPVSAATVDWSITVDDPSTWVRPFTWGMQLTKDDKQQIYEYACHEGNEGLRGILAAARAAEQAATGTAAAPAK